MTIDTNNPFIMKRAYELMCEREAEIRDCDTYSFREFHDRAINECMVNIPPHHIQ